MHALAFSFKRIDQSLLAVQRHVLAPLGITPARVELLVVLATRGSLEAKYMRQSDIWLELGVSRSTTSRMLAAMERDGWVARSPECRDRRQVCVQLTPKGRSLLLRIEQLAFRFQLTLRLIFGKLDDLLGELGLLRWYFDRALFHYPTPLKLWKKLPEIPMFRTPACWMPIFERIRSGKIREEIRRQRLASEESLRAFRESREARVA